MDNKRGVHLIMDDTKGKSSRASDLASLNLTGSDSEGKRGQDHGTTLECENAKFRDGIRDEWLNLEVSYSEIKGVTDNFSESLVIGRGGFGKVYRAKLDGRTVAIKILDSTSTQGQREFFQEIEVLHRMQHPHLVKLVGACFDEARALVYEFLPNGSLEECLKESPKILTWQMRTRIIYEICLALIYLHSKSVIHADLKPANVLLDANFKSKLSDFGLCRFLPEDMATAPFLETSPMGTHGYADPWFLERCILRPGSDLYSLGITVLKLLTGMSPIGLGWKIRQTDKDLLRKMIDPSVGDWPFELAKEMVYWSLQCCFHNENSSEVLMGMSTRLKDMLAEIDTLQEPGQAIQNKSRGLEPPSHNVDKKEVIVATNPPSSSSFSEPEQPIRYGSRGLEPPSHNEDKKEAMVATNPTLPSFFSEVDEPLGFAGGNLVYFGGPFVFKLDEILRALGDRTWRYPSLSTVALQDGNRVAVKSFNSESGMFGFEKELNVLGEIRHENILALRAYCTWPEGPKVLVFDFVPRGSLYDLLHVHRPETRTDWQTRMNIAIGIARGLKYLHKEVNIIHGNLTSRNILLDSDTNPKISGYERSCLIRPEEFLDWMDTFSNVGSCAAYAPEHFMPKKASTKIDVYSLGVIILEIVTGKSSEQLIDGLDLPRWVALMEGPIRNVLDPNLLNEGAKVRSFQVSRTLELARKCVHSSAAERPQVGLVLLELEEIKDMFGDSIRGLKVLLRG